MCATQDCSLTSYPTAEGTLKKSPTASVRYECVTTDTEAKHTNHCTTEAGVVLTRAVAYFVVIQEVGCIMAYLLNVVASAGSAEVGERE